MNDDDMKRRLEHLTDELQAFDALRDEDIDLSDMPEVTDDEWKSAVVGKYHRPIKQQLTLRIDADVVDWFKRTQPKYQTAMNEALRHYMEEHMRRAG